MPGMAMTTLFWGGLGKVVRRALCGETKGGGAGGLSSVVPGDETNGDEGAGLCIAGIGDCDLKKPGILLWTVDFTLDRLS